jgi:hypothetical protein
MRELSEIVREGKTPVAKLRAKLEAAADARVVPPLMSTMGGGGFGIGAYAVERLSLMELLRGLYLPTGAPEWYVPPERRYAFGQSWSSPNGIAVASKGSGDLYCVTRARLAGKNDHSEAGVYIRLTTTGGGFGQINRLRLETDIAWSATADASMDWDWARFTAASVHVVGKIWLVAYEHNIATNMYEPLLNQSAVNKVLFHQSMSGSGASPLSTAGIISAGKLVLDCIVSPARNYLLGVVAQTQVSRPGALGRTSASTTRTDPGGVQHVCSLERHGGRHVGVARGPRPQH